jgi:hypothetical protein
VAAASLLNLHDETLYAPGSVNRPSQIIVPVSSPFSFRLSDVFQPTRRSIFVSYHHGEDQAWYDTFYRTFHSTLGVITDTSVDRLIDSDDSEYVMRRIREEFLTGSSCTIVLCGRMTPWRKYVDWEIKASLDMRHGVIGIQLPTITPNPHVLGSVIVPDRLDDNIRSGYALWCSWSSVASAEALRQYVETAIARPSYLIENSRPLRQRNG